MKAPWETDPATGQPNWLVYANQGAVRNQPVNDHLYSVLQQAARAAGIDQVRVFSGGQPSSGGDRTGSHRHDGGGAADINLMVGGRALNFENPADRPMIQAFVSAARAAGATGIGAGKDYMGPTSLHVGFGTPAVWGAGGRSTNAPSWLVEAYNARPGQFEAMAYAPARQTSPGQQAINAAFQPTSRSPFSQMPVPAPNLARNFGSPTSPPLGLPAKDDDWLNAARTPAEHPLPTGVLRTAPQAPLEPTVPYAGFRDSGRMLTSTAPQPNLADRTRMPESLAMTPTSPSLAAPLMPGAMAMPGNPFPMVPQQGQPSAQDILLAAMPKPPPMPPMGRPSAPPMPGQPGAPGRSAPVGPGAPSMPAPGHIGPPGGGPFNMGGAYQGVGYQGPPGPFSLAGNEWLSPWMFDAPVYSGGASSGAGHGGILGALFGGR